MRALFENFTQRILRNSSIFQRIIFPIFAGIVLELLFDFQFNAEPILAGDNGLAIENTVFNNEHRTDRKYYTIALNHFKETLKSRPLFFNEPVRRIIGTIMQ